MAVFLVAVSASLWLNEFCMNTTIPTIVDEASVMGLLKSLGFVEVTDICVLSAEGNVLRKAGSTAQSFRGCWGVDGHNVAVICPIGGVYLHYGHNNGILNGEIFKDIIKELGCKRIDGRTILGACTPDRGEHLDCDQLMRTICGQAVLV